MARLGMNILVVQLSAHARSAWDTEDRFRAMAATGEISVPSAAGVPSGASVGVRPAASRRRVQGRGCPFRVGTTSSSCEGAVVGTASRLAIGLRPLHLKQRPFETASVAGPNGRLVPVSVSTPAGHQRRQPLPMRRSQLCADEVVRRPCCRGFSWHPRASSQPDLAIVFA